MEYRLLGRSGLKVSALAMGTATLGRADPSEPLYSLGAEPARRHLAMCRDVGINILDTADAYGGGASEEILGEVLAGRRNEILIATKIRFPMGKGPNDRGLSRHHIVAGCEASLKRLRTDYIDLYQFHEWDGLTPVEEIMEAGDSLVRGGKVRYLGCSNFSGWHIMKALGAAALQGGQRFVSQQIHYTLFSREAEYELVPISLDQGLGIMVWSPLAAGLLTGKYGRGKSGPAGSRHMMGWKEPPVYDEERLLRIVDVLKAIAKEREATPARVALAWVLGRPAVASVVIGARTDEQFRDNLAAADFKLSPDERDRLDKVSLMPLPYPYWHQAMTAGDRLSEADLVPIGPHLGSF
jgi:aryl-alcohol dehydrogenase-like predicted oxidoreductase